MALVESGRAPGESFSDVVNRVIRRALAPKPVRFETAAEFLDRVQFNPDGTRVDGGPSVHFPDITDPA